MYLSDLKPGTDYDVVVESQARHQNQREAWDPHDPYLCKELGTTVTFRTGHPPIVPTEFSVIGCTTKSLKLAWNEPLARGVPISKFLVTVSTTTQSIPSLNLTDTLESVKSATNDSPRYSRRCKSKKHVIANNNQVEISPRVYEIPSDTVIYEVKNLLERTEYIISLHIITPHSDSDKIKELYDSPVSVNTVENDIWTPYVIAPGVTAGIDPPDHLHVTKRTTNHIHLEWKPAKAYGMYSLLHNVIRWNEVQREEKECISSREKIVTGRSVSSGILRIDAAKSEAIVSDLYPGSNFEFRVEACFGTLAFNPENENVVSEISQTNPVISWTRAPPAKPRLHLRSISQNELELFWDKPALLDLGKVTDIDFVIYTQWVNPCSKSTKKTIE